MAIPTPLFFFRGRRCCNLWEGRRARGRSDAYAGMVLSLDDSSVSLRRAYRGAGAPSGEDLLALSLSASAVLAASDQPLAADRSVT